MKAFFKLNILLLLFLSINTSAAGISFTTYFVHNGFVYSGSDTLKNQDMKCIGIIGGVSWVSSMDYYKMLNEMIRDKFGNDYSAKILMYSIPFHEFSEQERLANKGDWSELTKTMIDAAQRLKQGGADFIIIASNTMNSTAEILQEKVNIPVLHIADATGAKIVEKGYKKIALLGTKYTMENNFYKDRLTNKYGLKVIIPNQEERDYINKVIFDELCNDKFYKESKEGFVKIIMRLIKDEGVEGVILGCTEIPLLVKREDVNIPLFMTNEIHCEAAIKYALEK